MLADIFNPPSNSTFAAWEQMGIRNGHLVFLDDHAQPLGQVTGIVLAFERQASGATGTLTGAMQTDTVKVPLSLKADYETQTQTLTAHGEISDLPLALLAGFNPALARLSGAAVPAVVSFEAVFDPAFQLNTAHLAVTLGEGLITLPDVFPAPVPVASGAIDLSYTANPRRIDLYGLGIDLKGPVFNASAVATQEDTAWHFDLTALLAISGSTSWLYSGRKARRPADMSGLPLTSPAAASMTALCTSPARTCPQRRTALSWMS